MRRTVLFAAAILVGFAAGVAHADDDVELARAKFTDGIRLYRAGDDLGARAAFLEAERAHHAAVTLYNLALVEERLGHMQAAVDDYERYLAESGEKGEFSPPAVVALAEIRKRAGKLRIDTDPPGAQVFVDGALLEEPSPVSLLLRPGKHHVTVEWSNGRASTDTDVEAGTFARVHLDRPPVSPSVAPVAPPPSSSAAPASTPMSVLPPAPPPAAIPEVDGLVFGGEFMAVPIAMFKSNAPANQNQSQAIFAGVMGEIGYAFADHAYVGLRAIGAAGASCRLLAKAHLATIGPVIEYHLTRSVWIGASFNGGNGEDCKADGTTLSTDIVFSPMLDASYAITSKSYGQWLVTLGVGYFFANPTNDNGLLYAPIGFGPRFF